MQASRRLFSPALAVKGFLIPPQTTWGIFGSAGQACWRLLQQTERDSFLGLLNKDVINAQVLGQADIGFWRILALYNDLNSPLFKQYGFDGEQFTSGAKLALEQFHVVQHKLQESLHSKEESSGEETDKSNTADVNGESVKDVRLEADLIAAALGGETVSNDLQQVFKQSWEKEAEENPESLAAELKAMVTHEFFHVIEISSKTNYLVEKRLNFTADSGKITNIALLSARAMAVVPEFDEEKIAEPNDDAPMKDPSLEESPGDEEDPPVVAQVEVLYDIEQFFTPKAIKGNGGGDGDGDNTTIDGQSEGQTVPATTTVHVGVFQGWLHGDPEGNESVRWRLALNRPAWEFPFLSS